ncbi:MAG: ATP-binding protein [Thermodesulfobacteriota bacterium]
MPVEMKRITEETFDRVLRSFNESVALDLREVSFIDPYGMVGLLELGKAHGTGSERKTFYLPAAQQVLKYLERMDFFKYASGYFRLEPSSPQASEKYLRSPSSDVLLEITPIEKSDDIHFIVGKVRDRAQAILATHLHYEERAINGFIVVLSEVCQNIIEHSATTGFVGIQKYYFQKINKNVVQIAVMDSGIGFMKSLSERFAIKDDLYALEMTLLHGVSRYADEGRGHGLAGLRRFAKEWGGKLSIRSGTAKLSILPEWAWGKERVRKLPPFPGAKVNILLPAV